MRLTKAGERTNPYLIVRWVPVTKMTDRDGAGIRELVNEIVGASDFGAAAFVLHFAEARDGDRKTGYGRATNVGKFQVQCSYTWSDKIQITLLIFDG